jgi:MFS family permease
MNMTVVSEQLSESRIALGNVFRNRSLRRLNLALVGSVIGDWALAVAFSVYAYNEGGATALGVVSVVRYVLMAVLAPFVSTLADRFDRRLVMIVADLVRVVLVLFAAAVVIGDGPAWAVYVLSIVVGIVGMAFRPAQAAILPSLVTDPAQLTAANVASSTINSLGFFVGPAIAGLMLAVTDLGVVFVFDALTFVWSAVMVAGLRSADERSPNEAGESFVAETSVVAQALDEVDVESDPLESGDSASSGGMFDGVGDGFRTIWGNRDLRLIVVLYVAQTIVAGCSAVYEVAIALDLLGLRDSGLGLLNASLGIGGIVGALVALVLAQRGRLARDFGIGVALWAAPLLLVVAVPTLPSALLAMLLIGVGNSVVDVNAETIVQRLVPDEVLGRVFGALDSAAIAGMALGAGLMPVLIATVGLRTGLLAIALVVTFAVLLSIRGLAHVDRTTLAPDGIESLRAIPMLAVLPDNVVERLARSSHVIHVPAGGSVFEQGDDGDRFYIIEAGEVEVAKVGQAVGRLGVGESFGEIALLRDVPRTATVVALTDLTVRTLERHHFLAAVTGHVDASDQAELVVGRYMDAY